jgi:polyhydroxybutyrate depolymerase
MAPNRPLPRAARAATTLLPFAALCALSVSGTGHVALQPPPITAAETSRPKHGEFPSESIKVGDATREYRLVVPKSVDLTKPAPLVFAFHGMLIDSKDLMPRYTGLNKTAETGKFLLVYPEAVGKSWGIDPVKVRNDLAFFDALLDELARSHKVDRDRVYVLGMSNGGYFAHIVGRERSRTVAAVASHSGPLGLETLLGVNAPRKFPVLIIHGDKDPLFPVAFARENRDKYQREGHEVRYVEVPGLGHQWATSARINDTIHDVFARNSLPRK